MLIVRPIFNLLVLIYNLLPGHNFGLAIIVFTVIVRLLMWPLVKKQLHQTKMMRKLQPEMRRVKAAAKGNKQKEQLMLMELYKERGVNPLATFPTLIVQFIVLIGLYSGLRKVVNDPHQLVSFAYPGLQHLHWMQQLAHNIKLFDDTLFGVVDLSRSAVSKTGGGIYLPAMVIVLASAVMQYYQTKQLMPTDKDARSLRQILKSAGQGKQADNSEINAAVGQSTRYLFPGIIFLVTVNVPSAISLYWFIGGLVAFIQQFIVLREDSEEMEAMADKPEPAAKQVIEGEVIEKPKPKLDPNRRRQGSKVQK